MAKKAKATLLDIELQNASYGKSIPIMSLTDLFEFARKLVATGKPEKEAAVEAVNKFAAKI